MTFEQMLQLFKSGYNDKSKDKAFAVVGGLLIGLTFLVTGILLGMVGGQTSLGIALGIMGTCAGAVGGVLLGVIIGRTINGCITCVGGTNHDDSDNQPDLEAGLGNQLNLEDSYSSGEDLEQDSSNTNITDLSQQIEDKSRASVVKKKKLTFSERFDKAIETLRKKGGDEKADGFNDLARQERFIDSAGTLSIMDKPVMLSSGYSMDEKTAHSLLQGDNPICPFSRDELRQDIMITNLNMRDRIRTFIEDVEKVAKTFKPKNVTEKTPLLEGKTRKAVDAPRISSVTAAPNSSFYTNDVQQQTNNTTTITTNRHWIS